MISSIKETISLSVIPACIFNSSQLQFPLSYKCIKTSNNLVFPTPVSPINITGIFASIFNKILIIFIKLSETKI